MAATKSDIRRWFARGLETDEYSHFLVICDTFDHEDFPVFVPKGANVREFADKYIAEHSMTRLMECYDLSVDMGAQLNEHRAFNW